MKIGCDDGGGGRLPRVHRSYTATVKRMARWGLYVLLGALSILTVGAQQAFLFAGQSNTVGHTVTQSSDPTQFQGILDILGDTSLTDNQKKARLETKFLEAEAADSDQAAFFAQYVMQLEKRGQMKDIETPIPNAFCSFIDPSGYNPGRYPSINVSPTSGCGSAFGTELMFAQTLVKVGEPWSTTDFEIAKVAQGGSKIYKDWVSPKHRGMGGSQQYHSHYRRNVESICVAPRRK
jgi:hypothetical protein